MQKNGSLAVSLHQQAVLYKWGSLLKIYFMMEGMNGGMGIMMWFFMLLGVALLVAIIVWIFRKTKK